MSTPLAEQESRKTGIIIPIDPVTRLEGHLKVEIEVDKTREGNVVVDAKATGTLFRGFEKILIGRNPEDAPHITQRICGVCPVPHGMAAVLALDSASNVALTPNARILRNLVLGANFLDSHVLHFYHLAAMDYIEGPAMAPWQPGWKVDNRFDSATTQALIAHYLKALDIRRKAHEMGAIFGGKLPHTPTFIRGGITSVPKAALMTKFAAYLAEIISFIQGTYLPDVEALCGAYSDYDSIGRGPANFLAFGVFDVNGAGGMLLKSGFAPNASTMPESLSTVKIAEHVNHSWYASASKLNPSVGDTEAQYPKPSAYSWLKAPRYSGQPAECGPLARMWINGDYRRGVSVNDRARARAQEALKIAQAMSTWVTQLIEGGSVYRRTTIPASATSTGLTEAPRGAVGHWVNIAAGKIARYQIITPTCWNASPADDAGVKGPLEQALIGTKIKSTTEPIEVLRVIHSFDPCLGCAVHVSRPGEGKRVFAIPL